MPKRVLYSGFKWQKHDDQSGYQHVVPQGSAYVDGAKLLGGRARFRSPLNRINLFLTDLVTAIRGLSYDCVFIFYPEHSVYVSPFILRLAGVKVIYAVHIDETYWFGPSSSVVMKLKRWQTRFVSQFVVLSNVQAPPFRARFKDRVTFIPHGIWHRRNVPLGAGPSSKITIIGDSYRDYDLLIKTTKLFEDMHPEVEFHLVGIDKRRIDGGNAPRNIIVHARLDSEDYYGLIADSEFVFLPLTYAAANNALLEGLSLGVPVFSNDVEGVTDYLPSAAYVVSGPEDLAAVYAKRMTMSEAERRAEQTELKNYSRKHFDWEVIHERIRALCEAL